MCRFAAGVPRLLPLLLLLNLSGVGAQQPQQPVFRAGSTLVRVDVTVLDRDGDPVTTLTADDFEVEEDGVRQTVQACTLVSASGQPPADDSVSLAIRSPEHAAAEAARDDVRVFLIFWDEYHIDQFASAIQAREALTRFVTTAFGPTDLVAIMDPLTPVDALAFTRDRDRLAQAVQKLRGRLGQYTPTRSAAEDAMLDRGDVARLRTEVTLSALKAAAVHLGSLREGRKSIIFASEGFPLRSEAATMLDDLIQTANDNNTAIYTLDPRGLAGGVADVIRLLADNTGAEAIVNSNQPLGALRQIVKESSAFYLIGYTPTRSPADDGRFHEIRVRVRRPRLDVRARRGYWAPSAQDIERLAKEREAAAPPTAVSQALSALANGRAEQSLNFWIGASRGADGSPEVEVAWSPRSSGTSPVRGGTISVSIQEPAGRRAVEAPVDRQHLTFAARPGALQLRVSARDAAGDVVDEESRTLTVPDFSGPGVTISSPIVLRAQNISEYRAVTALTNPVPYAGREFTRTDRLLIRFEVYGEAAMKGIGARLLSRDQRPLVDLVVTALPAGAGYQLELPLASLARGDYLAEIAVTAGSDRATALVPLRVVS